MRQIEFRPRASVDFRGTVTYAAFILKSPKSAEDIAAAIFDELDRLAEFPELGTPFLHEDLDSTYRRMLVKQHWIYYTYSETALTVWRIFHVRQDHDAYGFEDI